jgi:hypothetical protein
MYFKDFIERNSTKPFITNLQKYSELSHYGKCKTVSTILTHLYIDAEQGNTKELFEQNFKMQEEILSILTELTIYKIDNFISWLTNELNK